MFDISNENVIIDLIDRINDDNDIVFPLYVKIFNKTYSLLELDEIDTCNSFSFKIGFGNKSSSLHTNSKIPINKLFEYDSRNVITKYDEESQVNIKYIIFESRRVDDDGSLINTSINKYYDMIFKYVMKHVEEIKRERDDIIEEQE